MAFFSFFDGGFAQIFSQIASITVKKLRNTNFISSRHVKRENTSLPVDVRRSKTSLLKLPIISAHYPPQNCAVVRCLLYYCGLQIFFISFGKGRGLFTLLLLATPLFFLIQTYFHFRVIFTCLGAQQLPALIKRRCMEGPALK